MSKKISETDSMKLNRIRRSTNFLLNFIFLILAIVCILPVMFVFIISISSKESLMYHGYQIIPEGVSLDSYLFLWRERVILLKSLGISIFVTLTGTILGLFLTTTMGYVLSRKNYKMNSLLTWVVFIPMIFNGGMLSSYVINTNLLGLKNNILALILPIAVSSFHVIICKTFFRTTIPDSIIESAKIDGASQFRIFGQMVIPMSKPVLATIGLFLTFGYWNDWFLSSLYISDKNMQSLQALLNNIQKNIEYLAKNPAAGVSLQQYKNMMPQEGVRMAIAIVIVFPIACAYPFFQKYFVSGLTIGAVKG
jgi:putative aldouronate transport system permease protein